MLELTKLRRQLAEKRAQLSYHVRRGDTDRASWCKEDIAILEKREKRLANERKAELRIKHASYQRTYYQKRRREYLDSPLFAEDTKAQYAAMEDRKRLREVAIAQREAQKAERKARIAAMSPEERHAFFKAERSKNSEFLKQKREAKKYLEKLRVEAAQARRRKYCEALARLSAEREAIYAKLKAQEQSAGPTLNTNANDTPGLLIHHNDEQPANS